MIPKYYHEVLLRIGRPRIKEYAKNKTSRKEQKKNQM